MGYHVDLPVLEGVIHRLENAQSHLDKQLHELDRIVASLDGVWKGETATAQSRAHARWSADARDMHHALQTLHGAADTAHGNYSAAVTTNQRMWEQVR